MNVQQQSIFDLFNLQDVLKIQKTINILQSQLVESIAKKDAAQAQEKPWIPALVKFVHFAPDWWQSKEKKMELIGQCILVQEIPKEAYASFRSIRANSGNKGNWFWAKEDLILFPSIEDYQITQHQISLSKGYKRRPL